MTPKTLKKYTGRLSKISQNTRKKMLYHYSPRRRQFRNTLGIHLNGYKEVSRKTNVLVYPMDKIQTPYGKKPAIYADFIASGRPSPFVENYISKNIFTKYSNTHSNCTNGIYMKNEIEKVRQIIRKEYGVDDTYNVLFKGSGSTDCINFLLHCLDYNQYDKIHIFLTVYEHYSNHLPFVELCRGHKQCQLHIIPTQKLNHELDLLWVNKQVTAIINQTSSSVGPPKTLVLASIIHCSNLTGYFIPMEKLKKCFEPLCSFISNNDKKNRLLHYYCFTDLACSAPYVINFNGSLFDAIFLSPHKFIGGVGTPGVLIAKNCLFQKTRPFYPGGACVKQTHCNRIEYAEDIETRESAGTPAIIGILKIGQCILLKEKYRQYIQINEQTLTNAVREFGYKLKEKIGKEFYWIEYDSQVKQLPIFTFAHRKMHYNYMVVLLNDLFGIQSRGGKSCAGLFMDILEKKEKMDGLCRVSFHWTMSIKEVVFIMQAIEYVLQFGQKYISMYLYDKQKNLWHIKNKSIIYS